LQRAQDPLLQGQVPYRWWSDLPVARLTVPWPSLQYRAGCRQSALTRL